MFQLEPSRFAPAIAELLAPERLNDLGPGKPCAEARKLLDRLTVEQAFGDVPVQDEEMARCCLAGLWLLHNFLDESHRICQEIETPAGSYWHAIMHRREPDFPNSKYWFRQVGRYPTWPELCSEAHQLAEQDETSRSAAKSAASVLTTQNSWDPYRFVDLCELATSGQSSLLLLCQQIQRVEWDLLFADCYQRATNLSLVTPA